MQQTAKMILSLQAKDCGYDLSDIPEELRAGMTVGDLMMYRQTQKALSPVDLEGFDTTAFREVRNTADGMPAQFTQVSVESVSAGDISLDDALAIADTLSPEKSVKKPARRSKKAKTE